ncbi:MAG: HdeD family acid-resistance protein [Solirubrobacterales bacterium]
METASSGQLDPMKAVTRLWWIPLIVGIAWLIVSLIVLRFDATSVTTVGILAGIVFIAAGATDLMMSMLVEKWRVAYAILGVILIIVGIVALMTPQDTFLALAAVIGWFLLFKGTFDIVLALSDRDAELWWLTLVLGIVEIGLAFWAAGYFGRKAVLLIVFVAAASMARGITQIVVAFQLRHANKELT